jgi:SPP1 gp7 family putative phage head morphogenesis protein
MATSERRRIEDAVRVGVVNGETTQNIVRSVWGTIRDRDANSGSSAVIKTRRGAEALVRTAINHVSTAAKDKVFNENKNLIKSVTYTATLDSKTTPRCQSLDNTVWPIDSGPRPPQHFRCRSTMTPNLRTYRELGINVDEPAESTRAYFAIPEKMNVTQYRAKLRKEGLTKAQQDKIISSLSGQTDDPDFGSFLNRQTKEFQETVLGKTRTELYRKGDLTLKELISPQGKYYTLDELRRLQPDAFDKAGVE